MSDYFVACSQLQFIDQNIYLKSPHIGVSSRRTGMLVEDIYLTRKQHLRQVFLRCQHYSTALQILEHYPNAILTIPKNVLMHLQVSEKLKFLMCL